MQSGKSVYLRFYEAIRGLESDSRQLSSVLSSLESSLGEVVGEREELYTNLAQEFLPEMDSDAIQSTLHEVQYDLQKIYQEKEKHRRVLEEESASLLENKQEKESIYHDLTDKLDSLASKRIELEDKVSKQLKDNKILQQMLDSSNHLSERVKQYQERSLEIKKEAEEKLPDFKKDILFSYLLSRNFATPKYKSKGLSKRLDNWVSKKVSFKSQLKNYQFLQTTPALMELEVERVEKELFSELQKIEAEEKKVADKLGLTKVREEGRALGQSRDKLMGELEEIEKSFQELVLEREELENDRGRYYAEAIKKLQDYLESKPVEELRHKAKNHPGRGDDVIVSKIESLEQSIFAKEEELLEIERRRGLKENQLESLGRICAKYRREDFDSARSFFAKTFDAHSYLDSFLAGNLTEAGFWSSLAQSQHFSRPARRYNPIFEQVARGSGGIFDSALGEILMSGQMGSRRRRRRGGIRIGAQTRGPSPKRRGPVSPNLGGGGFSSGSGF